jgi:hypothetical protein
VRIYEQGKGSVPPPVIPSLETSVSDKMEFDKKFEAEDAYDFTDEVMNIKEFYLLALQGRS